VFPPSSCVLVFSFQRVYSYRQKDGLRMGAGGSSGNKKGLLLETLADHEESINCMVISEDGSMLVTGSEDATAR
jgi:hypothetical protein